MFKNCFLLLYSAGMAYTNFSNDFIGHSYDTAKPGLINITEDGQTFLTGALEVRKRWCGQGSIPAGPAQTWLRHTWVK